MSLVFFVFYTMFKTRLKRLFKTCFLLTHNTSYDINIMTAMT